VIVEVYKKADWDAGLQKGIDQKEREKIHKKQKL